MSIDDMKRFNQKEIKKKRYTKSTWYNWLINYVPGPIRQTVGGFKGKGVCILRQTQLRITVNKTVGAERNQTN